MHLSISKAKHVNYFWKWTAWKRNIENSSYCIFKINQNQILIFYLVIILTKHDSNICIVLICKYYTHIKDVLNTPIKVVQLYDITAFSTWHNDVNIWIFYRTFKTFEFCTFQTKLFTSFARIIQKFKSAQIKQHFHQIKDFLVIVYFL